MHTVFVIFGSTGDLAKRKLIPALYNIFQNNPSAKIDIIGVGRRDFQRSEFLDFVRKESSPFMGKADALDAFLETVSYTRVDVEKPEDYQSLRSDISRLSHGNTQVVFYLSIAPEHFVRFVDSYRSMELDPDRVKVVFEKPFGRDLQSAKELNAKITEVFQEKQIYRIDHYVGKEAIQNILAFRFANSIFEPLWNNKYIDNIQITASETLGVEDRGGYYDTSGAMRDMVQNHLFQVLSLVTMDAPASLQANAIQQEKLKVFQSLKLDPDYATNTVFWQYEGYTSERQIAPDSRTETYVAVKLEVATWAFTGVPIYLRTGKSLDRKSTRIVVEFKEIPNILFKKFGHIEKNRIILEIQPREGIDIHFNVKVMGNSREVQRVQSKFESEPGSKEAYEKLIEDSIVGDKTLFTNWEMLEETWKVVDDLIHCKNDCPVIFPYAKGTAGPKESDMLLERDGRKWYA